MSPPKPALCAWPTATSASISTHVQPVSPDTITIKPPILVKSAELVLTIKYWPMVCVTVPMDCLKSMGFVAIVWQASIIKHRPGPVRSVLSAACLVLIQFHAPHACQTMSSTPDSGDVSHFVAPIKHSWMKLVNALETPSGSTELARNASPINSMTRWLNHAWIACSTV